MKMDMPISPARRCLVENAQFYFPFGEKLTRNVLKDYKGCQKNLKVLFLDCLDLMNVLKTIGSKTTNCQHLSIHLNQSCSFSLARNILILKVISAPDFDISKSQHIDYLWDLLYNFEWPESTLERFTTDVKSFIDHGLPEYCESLNCSNLDQLKGNFSGWLRFLSEMLNESFQVKNLLKERAQFNSKEKLEDQLNQTVERAVGISRFSSSGTDDFRPESLLRAKLRQEFKFYFETGSCRNLLKRSASAAINPTLLEPRSFKWRVHVTSCPFTSYCPLELDELEMNAQEGIAINYCKKVLKNLVAEYRRKQKTIDFHIHSSDDLQFCLSAMPEKFDVIDSSALADKVGLANLLITATHKLELHPDAVLLTQMFSWPNIGSSTVAQFVEESLCSPLSMIPAIYGFRLATSVELGSITLLELNATSLYWFRAPKPENLPISNSVTIDRCLKNLEKKCYFIEEDDNSPDKPNCIMKRYTPFTFNLVVTRLGEFGVEQDTTRSFQSEAAPRFALARKTLDFWTNRRPVTLMTVIQPFTTEVQRLFYENIQASTLRIILIPCNRYTERKNRSSFQPVCWAAEIPRAHYIDNFDLHFDRNEDNSFRAVQISFLLPSGHGLEETYCGALVDLVSGTTIVALGPVKDMRQEDYNIPHPIAKHTSPVACVIAKSPQMQVVSCQESETIYYVEIVLRAVNNSKGLGVSTDQHLLCESSHRITLSLSQPKGVEPLSLCFTHPFLIDDIDATLHPAENSIRLVLKKALCEPWPFHFLAMPKWNVEHLTPLKANGQRQLNALNTQFICQVTTPMESTTRPSITPLQDVRRLIANLFFLDTEVNIIVFAVKNPSKPLWGFHIHPPLLTTPSGCPMLLLSALDYDLADKLIGKGKLEEKQFQEHVQNFFRHKMNAVRFQIFGEKTADLLRYLLRLNSTKITPTPGQTENLPLGGNSPFLTTFLTPLYVDFITTADREIKDNRKDFASIEIFFGAPAVNPDRCARCGIQSGKALKHCSKCKIVFYCNAECQRADWKNHKMACTVFEP